MIKANYYGQTLYGQAIGPGPYAEFALYVGDIEPFGIAWDGWLANHWQIGGLEPLGVVVRPTIPNGFEYICTTAGQSGAQEPAWPIVIGATVNDGAAVWTCQALSTASLSTTISNVTWHAQGNIILSGQQLVGQVAACIFDTRNCTSGVDEVVNCKAFMTDGTEKTGQFKIKIA